MSETTSINLSSEKVRVFPFGSERTDFPLDRVLNEQTLSTLIRSFTSDTDYVCDYTTTGSGETTKVTSITFILHGYRFYINLTDTKLPSGRPLNAGPLYAGITLSNSDDLSYEFLSGNDEGNVPNRKFTGLTLYTDNNSLPKNISYRLQLLDDKGKIMNTEMHRFNRIYCGTATTLID